ncbi:MAG: hypothetical protein AB7O26_16835 [Planctomycetaceae bacterium]
MSNPECREFQRALDEAIELRQPPPAALPDHAAHCESCRSRWDEYLVLEEAIPLWTAAVPPVDFADAILSELANDEINVSAGDHRAEPVVASIVTNDAVRGGAVRADRRSGDWYVTAAVAASLLIGTLVFYSSQPREQQVADSPPIQVPELRLNNVNLPEQPEYTVLVQEAGSAYLELASDAASAIKDSAVLLSTASQVADSTPKPDRESPSWIRKVGSNLEPITSDVENAMDFLFKAPPPEPTPAT